MLIIRQYILPKKLIIMGDKIQEFRVIIFKNKEFKNKVVWTTAIIIAIGTIVQYILSIYNTFSK